MGGGGKRFWRRCRNKLMNNRTCYRQVALTSRGVNANVSGGSPQHLFDEAPKEQIGRTSCAKAPPSCFAGASAQSAIPLMHCGAEGGTVHVTTQRVGESGRTSLRSTTAARGSSQVKTAKPPLVPNVQVAGDMLALDSAKTLRMTGQANHCRACFRRGRAGILGDASSESLK